MDDATSVGELISLWARANGPVLLVLGLASFIGSALILNGLYAWFHRAEEEKSDSATVSSMSDTHGTTA